MVSTTNPEAWNKSESDSDSCLSNNSGSLSLSRHPSLAEISTITSNCATSPIMTGENYMERKLEALNSQAASGESSIAHLASQSSGIATIIPATPPKHTVKSDSSSASTNQGDEPLTPTANLKMLVSAASPAIRDRETKKRELFTEPDQTSPNPCVVPSFALPMFDSKVVYRNGSYVHVNLRDGSESEKMVISRKDKSLGLLCQRFLAKYPENPSPSERIEISLDEVAKDLSVERRRIYDIVNVLESVEVISRFAKNRYMWHGKTRLPQTLAKLKQFAVTHGFTSKGGNTEKENPQMACQSKCAKAGTNKLPPLLPKNNKVCLPGMGCLPSMFDGEEDAWARKQREADYCRKDKSLGVLSQKFLMMFLLSETRQVTLDDAANLLIDEEEEGKAKYKTKVRRLYDIANILSSLQLIQKVHIHNIQSGRKPGFRWIGIDLDSLDKLNKPKSDSVNPPKKKGGSKNSLVEKETVDKEESAFGRIISRRPSQQQLRRTKSEGNNKSKLPRSRSDRGFASKKRVLSCDSDNGASDKGDGYSIQEINGFGDDNSIRSPDSIKFHSELMKLKEQYPNRMSELLSACQGYLVPDENKKSRRTLFNGETSSQDDGPSSKRRKSSDDVISKENELENAGKFVHSATSPFKPFQIEQNSIDSTTGSPPAKNVIPRVIEGSPEQKILLEREKQKILLEEQKDFDLKDERWKRMEDELEKALSKVRSEVSKNNDGIHSSVGIQANLVDDVSPLKPLTNYVKNMKPWYPLGKDKTVNQSRSFKSESISPASLQAMGVTPIAPSPVSETTNPTSASVVSSNSVQGVNLVSLTSSNLQSLWTMSTCSAPSLRTTQAPLFIAMPQQRTFSSSASNPSLMSLTPSTTETRKLLPPTSHPLSEENCLGNIMQPTTNIMPPSSSLPMNIVSTLNNPSLIQESMTCLKDNQILRPLVSMQPSVTQGFSPRMVMTAIPGIRGPACTPGATPNQMTPILPKGITPQHPFSSVTGVTPCSNTVFVHSDIAKKLVMSDSKFN